MHRASPVSCPWPCPLISALALMANSRQEIVVPGATHPLLHLVNLLPPTSDPSHQLPPPPQLPLPPCWYKSAAPGCLAPGPVSHRPQGTWVHFTSQTMKQLLLAYSSLHRNLQLPQPSPQPFSSQLPLHIYLVHPDSLGSSKCNLLTFLTSRSPEPS